MLPMSSIRLDIMKTFGGRLVKLRKSLGLTQAKFATKHGVSRATQVSYEHDRTYPNANYLTSLKDSGYDVEGLLARSAVLEAPDRIYGEGADFQSNLTRLQVAVKTVNDACARIGDIGVPVDMPFLVELVYSRELDEETVVDILRLIRRSGPLSSDA